MSRVAPVQGVTLILMIINLGLLIWVGGQGHQCPVIEPPQFRQQNGQLMPCVQDPSSTPSRLVWNCGPGVQK